MKIMKTKERRPRMTPQRAEIIRLLDGNSSHPSAEEIYGLIANKLPGLSFATVYNTLQSLLRAGKIAEVRIDPSRSRFDPGTHHHGHLMCVECGRITDLPPSRPAAPKGAPRGFKVLRSVSNFYGVCAGCAKKEGRKERSSCQKK
jgi:Fur family peroxide stress response transcriptional regulator